MSPVCHPVDVSGGYHSDDIITAPKPARSYVKLHLKTASFHYMYLYIYYRDTVRLNFGSECI